MTATINPEMSLATVLQQIAAVYQVDQVEMLKKLYEAWEDAEDIKAAEEGWQDYLDHKDECVTLEEFGQEMGWNV